MARYQQDSSNASPSPSEPLVLLKENRLAHSAAQRLLSPAAEDSIWLVYLYGPAGVGKSHLVRHFVREARRKNPKRRIICETAAEFLVALTQAFVRQDRVEFQERYAAADLFVLEDVASLQGRMPAQRMLIAILDELKQAGRRALVTAASRPGGLEKMAPRLVNRLRGGLCVPIELLGRTSRLGFATNMAASRQIPLSAPAAAVLAEEGPGTPRELLAALVNFDMHARNGRPANDEGLLRAHLRSSSPEARRYADQDRRRGGRLLQTARGRAALARSTEAIDPAAAGRHAVGPRAERPVGRADRPLLRPQEPYDGRARLQPHARSWPLILHSREMSNACRALRRG